MGKKVLIVDDFRSVRNILRRILEKKDLEVLEAENGKEALKYFDGSRIDLLITDYDMPDLNGAQLIRQIKDMEEYQSLPVIVLTTTNKEKREDEITGLKINHWVVKPFDIISFNKLIDTQLNI